MDYFPIFYPFSDIVPYDLGIKDRWLAQRAPQSRRRKLARRTGKKK